MIEQNPGLGHNGGPSLNDRVSELVETANRWITERPIIEDEETAQKCSAFIDQINLELKAVEKDKKDEKQPVLDAAKAIDDRYKKLATLLETAKNLLVPARTAYLKKMQQKADEEAAERRRIAEEAARKAQEAAKAAQQAANPVEATVAAQEAAEAAQQAQKEAQQAERAPVNLKSAYGGRTASLRTTWHARVTDHKLAVKYYLKHPKLAELILQLANADARAFGKDRGTTSGIPGVEFYSEQN